MVVAEVSAQTLEQAQQPSRWHYKVPAKIPTIFRLQYGDRKRHPNPGNILLIRHCFKRHRSEAYQQLRHQFFSLLLRVAVGVRLYTRGTNQKRSRSALAMFVARCRATSIATVSAHKCNLSYSRYPIDLISGKETLRRHIPANVPSIFLAAPADIIRGCHQFSFNVRFAPIADIRNLAEAWQAIRRRAGRAARC